MNRAPTPGDPVHDPMDEFTLLCERCGYVLEGLDESTRCPECARPITESLPQIARTGSPWQRQRSTGPGSRRMWAGIWPTIVAMYTRPGPTLSQLRIEAGPCRMMGTMLSLIASTVLVAPLAGLLAWGLGAPFALRTEDLIGAIVVLLGLLMGWGCVLVVLVFLTFIEEAGILVFGRVHKRRITPAVAETVCAHACIGWITAAVLFWVAAAAAMLIGDPGLGVALLLGALFLGLLHFEVLVWMGVRRCRYANRSRSGGTLPH